jgi:hypothetical protein
MATNTSQTGYVYVYQAAPEIDLKYQDPNATNYLDKLEPTRCTREHLRASRGWALLKLEYSDIADQKAHKVCLYDQREPELLEQRPSFPLEALKVNKANADYIRSLEARGWWPIKKQQGDEMPQIVDKVVSQQAAQLDSAQKELRDTNRMIMEKLMAAGGKGLDLEGIAKLVAAFSPILAPIFKQLTTPPPPPPDPLDAFTRTAAVLRDLGFSRRGESGGNAQLADAIKHGVDRLAEVGAMYLQARQQQQSAPAAVALPPPPTQTTQEDDTLMMNPMRLATVAQQAIHAFNRGVKGSEFAYSLTTLEVDGEDVYDKLNQIGAPVILGFLKSRPEWPALAAREADVVAWLGDFVAFGTDGETENANAQQ